MPDVNLVTVPVRLWEVLTWLWVAWPVLLVVLDARLVAPAFRLQIRRPNMRTTRIAAALLVLGVFSVWGNGHAADKGDFGKREFESHCSVCHGLKGKGDGPFAFIGLTVADLTTLSKKNNGVFPVQRVYEIIDGTEVLRAHGTRGMPIWGSVYREEEAHFDVVVNPEAYVRARILALIDYISRLQAK